MRLRYSSFPAEDPSVFDFVKSSSPFRGAKLTNYESWWIDFLPSLKGYSPVRGDVVVDDKGVPVSGRKGGPRSGGRVTMKKVLIFLINSGKLNVLDKFSYFLLSDREYIGKDAFS